METGPTKLRVLTPVVRAKLPRITVNWCLSKLEDHFKTPQKISPSSFLYGIAQYLPKAKPQDTIILLCEANSIWVRHAIIVDTSGKVVANWMEAFNAKWEDEVFTAQTTAGRLTLYPRKEMTVEDFIQHKELMYFIRKEQRDADKAQGERDSNS